MRRRHLLATTALLPLALAACQATTTGGVTTVTLNVAEVNAWGQAIVNSASLLLAVPGVSTLVAPYASALTGALALVSADLTSFAAASGGAVTVTFNGTSAGAAVSSLLTDGQQVLSTVEKALGSQVSALGAQVNTYVQALQTIVSLLQAAVSTAQGAASAPVTAPMTEAAALSALNVKKISF